MIRYKAVNRKHKVCGRHPPENMNPRMVRFWKKHELGACDWAILAFHQKQLVGFFRFYKKKNSKFLYAAGSYVLRPYRGQGIAVKMWAKALRKHKPEIIDVMVASRWGAQLVKALKKRHKNIAFFVSKK